MYVMIASCVIPFVGVLMMSLLPNDPKNKWVKWGMFDITVVFSMALFLGWSMGQFCRSASWSPNVSRWRLAANFGK